MEGPVKERLTGALILVAALVIIVPEMLSGPEPQQGAPAVNAAQPAETGAPLRTYSMVLNGAADARKAGQGSLTPQPSTPQESAAQPPEAQPAPPAAVAEESTAQPATAAVTPSPAPSPSPPAAASVRESQAAPRSAREAPPASAPQSGSWWAQLGVYSSRDNADRLARELRAAGFAIDVSKVSAGGKELYRVRAGPVRSRADAQSLQARLASAGHKPVLVAP